jgi:hypothetical protein
MWAPLSGSQMPIHMPGSSGFVASAAAAASSIVLASVVDICSTGGAVPVQRSGAALELPELLEHAAIVSAVTAPMTSPRIHLATARLSRSAGASVRISSVPTCLNVLITPRRGMAPSRPSGSARAWASRPPSLSRVGEDHTFCFLRKRPSPTHVPGAVLDGPCRPTRVRCHLGALTSKEKGFGAPGRMTA